MINNTKNGSTREETRQAMQTIGDATPMKDKLVGGASGLEFISGAGVKAAKGAFQIIKNLLTRGSKPKNIGGFREFANPKLRNHFNPTKTPKSKPVDFKGPNPAHNIGAGGNSYPR
jgi:hypothetical protein